MKISNKFTASSVKSIGNQHLNEIMKYIRQWRYETSYQNIKNYQWSTFKCY